MVKTTPLFKEHQKFNPQWINYKTWKMPLNYGSQIAEHCAVRAHVGIFDISHMGIFDLEGDEAKPLLRYALANDVEKLKETGQALYSCMLNDKGGVIDDLIVYYFHPQFYRIVCNASRCERNFTWLFQLIQSKNFAATLKPRADLGIIAIQGPSAIEITSNIFSESIEKFQGLNPFHFFCRDNICFARTGYTGENGLEVTAPNNLLPEIWKKFIAANVQPCGLGARDTLRLEAGYNLYGNDMSEQTSPLISNLGRTVSFSGHNRNFVGKQALLKEEDKGVNEKLVGLVLKDKGMLKPHQKVFLLSSDKTGEITSAGYSPILNTSIALARLPKTSAKEAYVEYRQRRLPVKIVNPVFVRNGHSLLNE